MDKLISQSALKLTSVRFSIFPHFMVHKLWVQSDLIRYLKTDFSAEYQSHSYRNDYQPFTKSQLMVRMRQKCRW